MKHFMMLFLTSIYCSLASAQFADSLPANFKPRPELQKPILPGWFTGSYILQPFEELRKNHPAALPEDSTFMEGNWYERDEVNNVIITYQQDFDTDAVYEFIFEFTKKTNAEVTAMAMAKYGQPNFVKEDFPAQWRIKLQDGLVLQVWVYQNKLCIGDARKFFD